MFGTGVHLPLRMVKAHVTGLAGLGLPGFLNGESVPGMAGIAGGYAKPCSPLLQLFYLSLGLQPDLVTSSTAFHPFHQSHGLPVGRGHRFHRCPGGRMLSSFELFHSSFMAIRTGVRCWNLDFGNILG